jgi:hypothetical protein
MDAMMVGRDVDFAGGTSSRFVVVLAALFLTGCGDGKVIVRGTVAVDGQPIEEGSISLEPADGQGPTTGGMIQGGKYELTGIASVAPGEKIVRIVGLRKTGKMIEAGPPAPKGTLIHQMEQCVPKQFNDQSQLVVSISPGRPNTHNFELDSKSGKLPAK